MTVPSFPGRTAMVRQLNGELQAQERGSGEGLEWQQLPQGLDRLAQDLFLRLLDRRKLEGKSGWSEFLEQERSQESGELTEVEFGRWGWFGRASRGWTAKGVCQALQGRPLVDGPRR